MTAVDVSFDDSDPRVERIGEIFSVQGQEREQVVGQLAQAAWSEYELAFSGSRFPSTIKELRELRLRLLYENLPAGMPTDEQIGELFQMTRTQVATLVAGTMARFGPELSARNKAAVVAALEDADRVDDQAARIVAPDSVSRFVNDYLAQTLAPPLEKRRDASQTYDVKRNTFELLCERFGVDWKSISKLKWK